MCESVTENNIHDLYPVNSPNHVLSNFIYLLMCSGDRKGKTLTLERKKQKFLLNHFGQ